MLYVIAYIYRTFHGDDKFKESFSQFIEVYKDHQKALDEPLEFPPLSDEDIYPMLGSGPGDTENTRRYRDPDTKEILKIDDIRVFHCKCNYIPAKNQSQESENGYMDFVKVVCKGCKIHEPDYKESPIERIKFLKDEGVI